MKNRVHRIACVVAVASVVFASSAPASAGIGSVFKKAVKKVVQVIHKAESVVDVADAAKKARATATNVYKGAIGVAKAAYDAAQKEAAKLAKQLLIEKAKAALARRGARIAALLAKFDAVKKTKDGAKLIAGIIAKLAKRNLDAGFKTDVRKLGTLLGLVRAATPASVRTVGATAKLQSSSASTGGNEGSWPASWGLSLGADAGFVVGGAASVGFAINVEPDLRSALVVGIGSVGAAVGVIAKAGASLLLNLNSSRAADVPGAQIGITANAAMGAGAATGLSWSLPNLSAEPSFSIGLGIGIGIDVAVEGGYSWAF